MRTNYSNIRYHIYRELSKFQQKRTNDRSQLIDEITVPIFSGVISTSVAGILQKEVSNMLLFIPVMSLFFLVVLKMSKWVVCIYRNRIKPFFSPLKDQSQIAQNLEAESLAAKFNYEVTYLVSTAYTEILKKESKSELRNLRILDICFYVNNAIRKIQESLFSYPYPLSENNVSRNKIEAVMNVIYAIICEFKKMQDLPESYEAEIDDVQVKYDNTIESLNCMYELDLKQFS
jgi:hypothetical protein